MIDNFEREKSITSYKQKLTFYTNIPTPNQLDFFQELSKVFALNVVFYEAIEPNRQWNLDLDNLGYPVTVLKDTNIVKPIQRYYVSFHLSWSIFKCLKEDDSDIVIASGAYNSPNAILTYTYSKWRGKIVGFFGERLFPSTNWLLKHFKKRLLKSLDRSCDFLLCAGNDAVESYTSYGLKSPKYILTYNIDDGPFVIKNLDKTHLQKIADKLRIKDKDLVFLTTGSLIRRKGMDTVIKAFNLFKINYPTTRLIILGEGEEREKLEQLAANDSRICFVGFQEKKEIPYYYALADIFVFASRYDGWGLVINEAIAAGLPIISTFQCTAANEMVKDGQNGFLCDADSVKCILEKMILLQDESLRLSMKSYNQTLSKQVNSTAYATKLLQIVNTINFLDD